MGETIDGLKVYGAGFYPVELATRRTLTGYNRVPLSASVDVETGEVRFYVDRDDIATLRRMTREPLDRESRLGGEI